MVDIISNRPFKATFLVGGEGSGRKTAARIIAEQGGVTPVVVDAFYYEMRERCHAALKLFDAQRLPVHADCFSGALNEPSEYFSGLTPRACYARFGRMMSEMFGPQIQGDWVVQRLRFYRSLQEEKLSRGLIAPDKVVQGIIVIDDAPGQSYQAIVNHLGVTNCTQVVIHRQGVVSFPVSVPHMSTVRVDNPGDSIAAFENALRKAAPHIFIKI